MNANDVTANASKRNAPALRLPKWKRTLSVLLAALALISLSTAWPSYAAVPKLDTIRVALFIDLPSKYKLNTTAATYTSAAPLDIGLRLPSGTIPLMQGAAGQAVRFTLDDYKPQLIETSDFQAALAVLKRVKALGGTGLLTSLSKNNGIVYQVTEGSYATEAEAGTAIDRLIKDSALQGLVGAVRPKVAGPLHLEAGVYATEADARTAAAAFGAASVDAYPALKVTGDAAALYTVLVGAAADTASLNAIKAQAAKSAGGADLRQTDPASSYIWLREDHTISESAKSSVSLYAIPMKGAKVTIASNAPTGIKLTERYNRSYRGAFEISGFNNKLAVVNELPFEQYLYSVVGGEMPGSWHGEALKAQAVAARTYALYQGFGFQIAHVVDTVLSQVYGGISAEKPTTIAAVDATRGEVAMNNGKLIEAVFSSSAGGASADAKEIWGSEVPYLKTAASPDQLSEKGLYTWYRVVIPDGVPGYIRGDLLEETGDKSPVGLPIMKVKGDGVKVRPIPLVQDNVAVVGQLNAGTRVIVLEKTIQSNEMTWVRGPFSSDELLASIKGKVKTPVSGSIRTLEISQQGPSGRPTQILVNGGVLDVKYPDLFRSSLGGLPSTKFAIDETARMTIAGADNKRERPADGGTLYVIGADGAAKQSNSNVYIMNGEGKVRAATVEPKFRFVGSGYGHGVGLSQYGARGLAETGYDYKYILQYYYKDVTIVKE
ncbi:SpoIID/LytB domain-containing protein [Paenibacillus oenotherae]|uniref:SpoIID/LytB domain-containing protein n=1 Tax=Paenibacillus oenotherae TaxID=1435645 RepID=A0ABS7D9J0_9BACL|nr:SpoIID/LytB domain-containing protein [Paenibacillus oenotherae]MBW7476241.1 SpoIID/LytB domain-containing protein [Paenibacillus oenotherae]